jgi:hypothetical protein
MLSMKEVVGHRFWNVGGLWELQDAALGNF